MKRTLALLITGAVFATAATRLPAQGVPVPENWTQHCGSCHGKDGKGQTKAGQRARVKDMTDAEYQKTFTDEKAFEAVKNGMKDGTREQMKPFADKLSDDEIKQLVTFVRTLAKK